MFQKDRFVEDCKSALGEGQKAIRELVLEAVADPTSEDVAQRAADRDRGRVQGEHAPPPLLGKALGHEGRGHRAEAGLADPQGRARHEELGEIPGAPGQAGGQAPQADAARDPVAARAPVGAR